MLQGYGSESLSGEGNFSGDTPVSLIQGQLAFGGALLKLLQRIEDPFNSEPLKQAAPDRFGMLVGGNRNDAALLARSLLLELGHDAVDEFRSYLERELLDGTVE